MQPSSISPFPSFRNGCTEHGRGSSGGAAGGADCPGGGCTHAALVGPPHATPFSSPPFPFPTSPSHPLPSSFKPREQSIGEAAAAVQQVRATVLVVDAHMLPWWAHLKPLCPSLRLGVLISEGPTATTPSSASSSSALSHTALILQSLAKLACAGYRHDDVSHVTLLKCRSHNTGTPKAAALSHTALISQSLAKLARAAYRHDDAAALSHTALISQSLAKLACAGYCHDDAFLHVAPLCHIGGISSLLAMLTACARNVLVPRFLPSHLPRLLSRHRITALIAVPAMLTDLLNACSGEKTFIAVPAMLTDLLSACSSKQREPSTSFPLVRTLLVGGGALSPSLQRHTEALFPCARLMLAYGMTEAASSITFAMLRDPAGAETAGAQASARPEGQAQAAPFDSTAVPSSPAPAAAAVLSLPSSAPTASASACCVGFPAPHVQVCIAPLPPDDTHPPPPPRLDPHSTLPHQHSHSPLNHPALQSSQPSAHKSCPVVGEVLTRGPHVMSGYWGRPDETAAVLSPEGWLRTGDMGWIDFSGQLWLLGRRKEMMKSGGENVFCAEVEEAVRAHPGVAAAAAAGVPDERMGEAVAVLLVLKPGWVWSGVGSNDSGGGDAGGAGGASDVGRFGSGGGSAARAAAAKNVSLSDLHAACQQHGLSRLGISPRQHNQRQQQQQRRLVGVFTVRSSAVENAAAETNVTDEGKQLQQRKAEWARVRGVAERGAVVRGRVVSANAGGLMVRLGPLQAFLPLSQLDPSRLRGTAASPAPSVADVTRGLVGSMVGVRVLELDEARTRLVVSEKRAAAGKGLPRVQQGRVYPGVVSSLTDFGAFVDLFQPEGVREEGDKEGGKGGEKEGDKEGAFLATGLVHVSELSWDPVRSPADVVAVGDTVNALVLQVDRERERVGLSLKQVQADPLLETLDRLLPFQPAPDATSPSASALEVSVPSALEVSVPSALEVSVPSALEVSVPSALEVSVPSALEVSVPSALEVSVPSALEVSVPSALEVSVPSALEVSVPSALEVSVPSALEVSVPSALEVSVPSALEVSVPSALEVSVPSALEVSVPSALEVSVPSALEVSVPSALEVSVPSALEVSVPSALEVSVPSALEVSVPSALEVSVPSALEVSVPSALEVSVPSALEVSVPSALEVSVPSALEASSAAPSSPLPGATSPPALPGLLALCNQLRQQPGNSSPPPLPVLLALDNHLRIVSVTLGRQAVERRVVSQDLELWLSNAPAAEGQFALLARAGRLVQEVQVVATLDREQMKEVLKQIS
ncbi:unnamed protein product [Closterium sp. NIES-65]|nr:unnamed protein product [Closterium sp. NIES-65]